MESTENKNVAIEEEVAEVVTEEVAEVEVDDATEVVEDGSEEITEEDVEDIAAAVFEASKPEDKDHNTKLLCGIVIGALLFIFALVMIATTDGQNAKMNRMLGEIADLKEQVATLSQETSNETVSVVTGEVTGVSSYSEGSKTVYFVSIGLNTYKVSKAVYEDIKGYMGDVVEWSTHTEIDEEGNKETWHDFAIIPVG